MGQWEKSHQKWENKVRRSFDVLEDLEKKRKVAYSMKIACHGRENRDKGNALWEIPQSTGQMTALKVGEQQLKDRGKNWRF